MAAGRPAKALPIAAAKRVRNAPSTGLWPVPLPRKSGGGTAANALSPQWDSLRRRAGTACPSARNGARARFVFLPGSQARIGRARICEPILWRNEMAYRGSDRNYREGSWRDRDDRERFYGRGGYGRGDYGRDDRGFFER